MREIFFYLDRMVPAVLLGLVAYLLSRPGRLRRLRARGEETTVPHEVCLLLFLMLTAGLLWLTVLPRFLWVDGRLVLQEEGLGMINLKPFIIFWQSKILAEQGYPTYFLINFWGNIAMFVPIGLFPTLLWRGTRWWKSPLGGFFLSAAIELCQIPIHRGTDVDDLWLNTLGAVLGFLLAKGLAVLSPRVFENCKVRRVQDGA